MRRLYMTRRAILGLALFGLLAMVTGCDSSAPTPGVVSQEAEAQNKAMMDGMKKAHAPGSPAAGARPKK